MRPLLALIRKEIAVLFGSPMAYLSLTLVVLVTALMAPIWRGGEPHQAPPELGAVPQFRLINRDGRAIDSEELLGAPWVADFIFTRCALSCPRMTERMMRLEGLAPSGLRRVSFSVDPEYDSPEVLRLYADTWGITDSEWLFLTGQKESIRRPDRREKSCQYYFLPII